MNSKLAAIVGLLLLSASIQAHAQDVEYCVIVGEIQTATEIKPKSTFELTVKVLTAEPTTTRGRDSSTDCSQYPSRELETTLLIPARLGRPSSGDRVTFFRSSVGTIDSRGEYTSSDVETFLRRFQKNRSK